MLKNNAMSFIFNFSAIACLLVQSSFAVIPVLPFDNNGQVALVSPALSEKRVQLFKGQVSFVPPSKFKPLTKKQLKRKLPDNSNPLLIVANVNQSSYVTVEYNNDLNLKPAQLSEVKRFVEGLHRNYSGWITSEIVEMNGREWFHFEYEEPAETSTLVAPEFGKKSKAVEQKPVRFHSYSTIFNGKLLSFNFVSEIKEYPEIKDAFLKSVESIQVKN